MVWTRHNENINMHGRDAARYRKPARPLVSTCVRVAHARQVRTFRRVLRTHLHVLGFPSRVPSALCSPYPKPDDGATRATPSERPSNGTNPSPTTPTPPSSGSILPSDPASRYLSCRFLSFGRLSPAASNIGCVIYKLVSSFAREGGKGTRRDAVRKKEERRISRKRGGDREGGERDRIRRRENFSLPLSFRVSFLRASTVSSRRFTWQPPRPGRPTSPCRLARELLCLSPVVTVGENAGTVLDKRYTYRRLISIVTDVDSRMIATMKIEISIPSYRSFFISLS